MRGTWLTQWALWMLGVGVVACSSSSRRTLSQFADDPGAQGRIPEYNEDPVDGGPPDALPETQEGAADAALDRSSIPNVEFRSEAGPAARPCPKDQVALESRHLTAGGATPTAFAQAYNHELERLHTPGPVLLLLTGVALANSTSGTVYLGALLQTGASVTFNHGYATTPFVFGPERSLEATEPSAPFELKFTPPAVDAQIPVAAVHIAGKLGAGCGELTVTKMKLLVPSTAATIAFGGSTVAALMGPPTENFGTEMANAWPLELSGQADEVYTTVSVADAGTAP